MAAPELLRRQAADLGFVLDAETSRCEVLFLEELLRWNRRINLTAIRDLDEGVEKHLLDSLTILPLLDGTEHLLDAGSGAGLPGIPLAIALPGLQVTSLDAVAKKIQFQRHAARLLHLQKRVHPRHERIEALAAAERAELYDVVVARAFSSLANIVDKCASLILPGGRLLAMKGAETQRELDESRSAIAASGLVPGENRHLTLPKSQALRTIVVLHKPVPPNP